ncbi:hypothetical protein [Paracoccus jeotgali]|uniref:Uncharacterized protein n=1 Tax=Paracoccus jeotgali TaxID=2065379 RepID=A0A2K9MGY9_9RHOB|nr:hypothetical protein [Paracoccus jeotgali]AUM74752.1 hypothetical protein CYR75_11085 [Paracoccus jeotgali]
MRPRGRGMWDSQGRFGLDMTRPGGRAVLVGAVLTLLWLLALLLFPSGSGGWGWVAGASALVPPVLIWIAVGLIRSIDALRAEAESLRALLDQHPDRPDSLGVDAPRPAPRAPAAQAAYAPAAQVVRSTPTSAPRAAAPRAIAPQTAVPAPQPVPGDPRQTSLGFDAPSAVELPPEIVIQALNFPDGPEDHSAIAALREALRDPDHARLIRSAQDVVTLLADRGIITDELPAGPTDASAWRRFADGQRGQAVSAMGAITDPAVIEAATLAMRGDDVFRDAVHHFLRLFDRGATALIPRLSDEEIVWLAETRSARAFMLLARAAGLFGAT